MAIPKLHFKDETYEIKKVEDNVYKFYEDLIVDQVKRANHNKKELFLLNNGNYFLIDESFSNSFCFQGITDDSSIKQIDKKAYLSSLAISDYIIVTCDSTSMISEAAVTGKPVYMAMMKPNRSIRRFKSFYEQFKELGIARELTDTIDNWSYDKLDEVNRIAPLIRTKMKENGII